jgi:hypothetical protein
MGSTRNIRSGIAPWTPETVDEIKAGIPAGARVHTLVFFDSKQRGLRRRALISQATVLSPEGEEHHFIIIYPMEEEP